MKIIAGVVSYEDGVKTIEGDQFSPSRKVRVELNFACDADESVSDGEILGALNKAQTLVQEKLGITGPTHAAKRTTKKTTDTPTPPAGPSVAETQEKNVKATAEASKATAKVLSDKEKMAAAQGLIPGAKPAADPAAIEDPTPPAADAVEDALADLEGATATPVTDADLNAAVKTKNASLKDPVKIRALAAEYNGGPGHTLAEIPQEKRAEFVKKLEALK